MTVLTTIAAARRSLEPLPIGHEVDVEFRALVTKSWSRGAYAGRWITDISPPPYNTANVIVRRNDLPDHVSQMRTGRRGIVVGRAKLPERGQHVVVAPTSVEVVERGALTEGLPLPRKSKTPPHIISSHLLGRLREIATTLARDEGYREFEPSYLSAPSSEPTDDLLSVTFQGWGSPLHLARSPAPQLLQVLIQTGEHKVFAIGRCFSAAYRDGFSSAEKLVLTTRSLNADLEEQLALAMKVVREILTSSERSDSTQRWLGKEWRRVSRKGSPRRDKTPQVEVFTVESYGRKTDVFRIVVPPYIVVAEGTVETWSPSVAIGGSIVHLERLVYVLSPSRLSEIRDLAAPPQGR